MNVIYIKWVFPTMLYNFPAQETALDENDGQSSSGLPQGLRDRIGSLSGMEILTMPFNFLAFNIFIASLLQQVLISFFSGTGLGYIATFQIRCYAMVRPMPFLIPFSAIVLAEIGFPACLPEWISSGAEIDFRPGPLCGIGSYYDLFPGHPRAPIMAIARLEERTSKKNEPKALHSRS
jgi:hypothetical protein